jgi:hypothetical protein
MPHHTPRRRPARLWALGLGAGWLLVGSAAVPTAALPTQTPPPSVPVTQPDPHADPLPVDEPAGLVPPLTAGLQELEVSSTEFDAAEEDLEAADEELTRIREIGANAARDLFRLEGREATLTEQLERGKRTVARLGRQVRRLRAEMRDLAVASYVSGGDLGGIKQLFEVDTTRHNELRSQAVMVDTVNDDLTSHLRAATADLEVARSEVTLTAATRSGVRARIREVRDIIEQNGAAEEQAARRVFGAIAEVETWRRLAVVEGSDIPLVVLDGYLKAAAIASLLAPECGITWWALAGIGRTESHHGSSGGAEVRADGTLTKPILGIPLDGSGETASITVEGGGPDRAQGPMQFITSTWKKWALDGNGDGIADVQNTYDAAAAAAAYLCAGGPMRTDDDLRRGYFSYNHSRSYVETVLERAHGYADEIELPPPD